MKKNISKKLLLGITGRNVQELKNKIIEVEKFKIKKVALFLTMINKTEKREIYEFLLSSNIKKIPLVHLRNDMNKEELKFLEKNFKTKCFTIHEEGFKYLDKWEGFHKKLYLELNYDDQLLRIVDVKKIGGFCIDFSHFQAAKQRHTKDFKYVINKRKMRFVGNHLNGYDAIKKRDMHTIKNLKDFDYLETLPKYVFGKYIALEMFNPILEQIKFKKYLINFLKNKI